MTVLEEKEFNQVLGDLEKRKVDHKIYTDPRIFELEKSRIFEKTWVNVGLEAEVPANNSYRTTYLGTIPVIITRDHAGQIHVLQNVCSHKGATVVRDSQGECNSLICLYHQWQFAMDGSLRGVPKYGKMPKEEFRQSDYGLAKIPRVETYHGIIFASLNPHVEPLIDLLEGPRQDADDIFSFGEYEIIGSQQLLLHANWKIYLENAKDGYHAGLLHRILPALGYFYNTEAVAFPNGHGLLRWPTSRDLRSATHERGAKVDIRDYSILETERVGWNRVLTLFPNTLVSHQADILLFRQIIPLAVDRTVIIQTGLVPKGSSEDFKQRSALQISNYQGSSGWVGYDDILAMNASQIGMQAPGIPANYLGMGGDDPAPVASGESEALIRQFFQHWASVMRA